MIDTIKIITHIDEETYLTIKSKSIIKTSFNIDKQEIYYEIVNDSLKGSFDSSLSVRVDDGDKYRFKGYVLEVEGSYHKIVKGHNAYDGFYNIQSIVLGLIKFTENGYNIKLPKLKHWFLQRIDITKNYDLQNQISVTGYINNFRLLNYPRRNLKFYENECVYITGQTTTLKIYNKLLEFIKNDRKKLKNFNNFDCVNFENKIFGYIRFELEIKKKKLRSIFNDKKFIRVDSLKYEEFEKIWCEEFMKILKFDNTNLKKVREKNEVRERLYSMYKSTKASVLYSFYLNILVDGYKTILANTPESTFYRKIKELKNAGIDFSQTAVLVYEYNELLDFNPFLSKEVV